MRRSASFDNFCCGGAILHGIHGFARVVFEVAEESFELRLHLANFGLLFFAALGGEVRLLALEFLLAGFHARAFGFQIAKVGVQAVEEARHILSLRAEARARGSDDGGIQSEPLRDVDSGGGSGDSDLQFVSWLQRGLVEADRGVDHSRRIRAINFERSVVRRDRDHASGFAKMLGDGNRQRSAFFGIGRGTQFVEQHQRIRSCSARDEVDVRDVRGKRREILLDRLIVADVGENGVENRHVGAIRGNGNAGLRHQSEQAQRFQGDGFAAGVGAGDHELAVVAFELDGDGDDLRVL